MLILFIISIWFLGLVILVGIILFIDKFMNNAQCPTCNKCMHVYYKKNNYIRYRCSSCKMEIGEWIK